MGLRPDLVKIATTAKQGTLASACHVDKTIFLMNLQKFLF